MTDTLQPIPSSQALFYQALFYQALFYQALFYQALFYQVQTFQPSLCVWGLGCVPSLASQYEQQLADFLVG